MDESQVLETLQKVGAFRTGHFVGTSGRHIDTYINKDALFMHPRETSQLCLAIAQKFATDNIEVVIAPAVGGVVLSQWTAYHLAELTGREVYALFADKDGQDGLIIKRGYERVIPGKRTLVVEDLVTTGGSVKKVVEASRAAGADIVAACVVGNRGDVNAGMVGNPPVFDQLLNVHLESWAPEECELCKRGIPVNTDVGHGKAFLAAQGK